jgi:moderate conductance mechanosensitive channel
MHAGIGDLIAWNAEWRAQWAEYFRPLLHVFLIWLLAWLSWRSLRRLVALLKIHIEARAEGRHDFRRIETLTSVFRYTSNIVIVGVAGMLTLGEVGISITPILATAGVAGIAIGFGAQSLVKDFFTGLFLLIENQVSEGDIIEVAGKSGYVERVTLRHIRMRDYDGSVHFIPNGMITIVTNRSREYAYAVIDINVARKRDLARVEALMHAAAEDLRGDRALAGQLAGELEIAGIEKLDEATLTMRGRLKVLPAAQWQVRHAFLQRMKYLLDRDESAEATAVADAPAHT